MKWASASSAAPEFTPTASVSAPFSSRALPTTPSLCDLRKSSLDLHLWGRRCDLHLVNPTVIMTLKAEHVLPSEPATDVKSAGFLKTDLDLGGYKSDAAYSHLGIMWNPRMKPTFMGSMRQNGTTRQRETSTP